MPRKFKHYKGATYTWIADATICVEPISAIVVYKDNAGMVWARPSAEFYGDVYLDNKLVRRFKEIPEDKSNNYADVEIKDDGGNVIGVTRVHLTANLIP